jgi:hypothetical protein
MALLERALAAPAYEKRRQTFADWIIVGGTLAMLVLTLIGSIAFAMAVIKWLI